MLTLTKGEMVDLRGIRLVGWTVGDGSGADGYHLYDYFRSPGELPQVGEYLGPDQHDIEPLVEVVHD